MIKRYLFSPTGRLAIALFSIFLSSVAPLILPVLVIVGSAEVSPLSSSGFATLLSIAYVAMIAVICLIIIGIILAFFTPLTKPTKVKLGAFIGACLLTQFLQLASVVSTIDFAQELTIIISACGALAYFMFLFSTCTELDDPESQQKFGGSIRYLAVAIIIWLVGVTIIGEILPLALLSICGGVAFFVLSMINYFYGLYGIVSRSNQLFLDGKTLPLELNSLSSSLRGF